MEVVICDTPEETGYLAGTAIAEMLARRADAVLGLATGSSPLPIYADLVARHRAGALSFAQVRTFTLDEYVGLPPDHPEAYRNVIAREFTDQVDLVPEAVRCPEGAADDLEAACMKYEAAIHMEGGVDLQILGIGTNGHIGFNEPGSSLASRTRITALTNRTRQDNARYFEGDLDAVPALCMTQGLGTIMEARHVILVALGEGKADAVAKMVEGPVSAMCPASILQHHPHVSVLLDTGAASRLQMADFYREAYRIKPRWQGL